MTETRKERLYVLLRNEVAVVTEEKIATGSSLTTILFAAQSPSLLRMISEPVSLALSMMRQDAFALRNDRNK